MPECQCCCGEQLNEQDLLKELAPIIDDYAAKPGGLIPVLQIVQNMMGYLPKEAIKEVSIRFKKPYSEVAGVVSFIPFFPPFREVNTLFGFVLEQLAMFGAEKKFLKP